MPLVKVEMLKGSTREYQLALLDGIHSGLVEAFKIPEYDRNQRLYELDRDCFEIPSAKSEQFVLIEITVFPGRSLEAKRNLYTAIVKNLEQAPGIDSNDVMIVLNEPPLDNWGIRGGKPGSEVDIGFNINV